MRHAGNEKHSIAVVVFSVADLDHVAATRDKQPQEYQRVGLTERQKRSWMQTFDVA